MWRKVLKCDACGTIRLSLGLPVGEAPVGSSVCGICMECGAGTHTVIVARRDRSWWQFWKPAQWIERGG